MSEFDPHIKNPFDQAPLTTEQMMPVSASQLLYDMYTERIDTLPGFSQRPYHEAKADFEKIVVEANDNADLEFTRMLLHQLVDKTAYQQLKNDPKNYWEQHGLEGGLNTYSYAFITNHRFFSDLPVLAGSIRDLRRHDPQAASRNLMVVGKLIPGMDVDMFGTGEPSPVTSLLSMIARQVQTVPKLTDAEHSKAVVSQREVWNEEAKALLREAVDSPGNILYIAANGSQDIAHDGKLYMQHVNPETAALLCNPRLKLLPLYISCDSFSSNGLVPSCPKYRLLPPQSWDHPDEVAELMESFEKIGTELLQDEFPGGVHYQKSLKDRAKEIGKHIMRKE